MLGMRPVASGIGRQFRSTCVTDDHAILVVSVPIFSIQIFTTSPALRNSPRAEPTPGRGAGEDQVAGVERHAARQTRDLLGER